MIKCSLFLILLVASCAAPPRIDVGGLVPKVPAPAGLLPVSHMVQDGAVRFDSQPPATLRLSNKQCLLLLGGKEVRLPMWPFADDGIPTDGAFTVDSGAYDFAGWQDETTLVISIGGSLTATRSEARYHFQDTRLVRTERLIKTLDEPLRVESR
jgi:hypothetical protein